MIRYSIAAACVAFGSLELNAQISLSGTSYAQNFDSIGSGLPTGWTVWTSAGADSFGTSALFNSNPTAWNAADSGGTFRNIESNDTTRAVGWRPVGNNSTEVAPNRTGAIMLSLENTVAWTNFSLSFDLFRANDVTGNQSYQFEYRVGDSGAFMQLGDTFLTDSMTFAGQTVTFSGTVLNSISNQFDSVHFRLRGVSGAGSTDLDTIGIDNFNLTYSAIPEPSTYGLIFSLGALGVAGVRRFRERRRRA